LELAGTMEARDLLRELAAGQPEAELPAHARSSDSGGARHEWRLRVRARSELPARLAELRLEPVG